MNVGVEGATESASVLRDISSSTYTYWGIVLGAGTDVCAPAADS